LVDDVRLSDKELISRIVGNLDKMIDAISGGVKPMRDMGFVYVGIAGDNLVAVLKQARSDVLSVFERNKASVGKEKVGGRKR